jgi:hypothetical protein
MASVLSEVRPVKPCRKPLLPVSVVGEWSEAPDFPTDEDLIMGAAVLCIDGWGYWCQANTDKGNVVGWVLRKFGGGEVYNLPRDLSGCDCGDGTFRPERPGGCRHASALRQALAARNPVSTPE